ncbi:hypothetical protein MMIC_P0966 [Mariprofundus micogutta]|uniref:Flagellar FliJ protein n=1 Tax=Mariprofundus micogutta TaxID=1921010 RepID=A0A1L8CM82_9PROT|nr:hypothetical protein [Mariprofundus micogutta]GAV20005.1 hypothetical protein MMIC_P0966 [Mariprofundus micogutta]
MKLETSRILTQLSEQERSKVEAELAEINGRKHIFEQQHQSSVEQTQQLNRQRDQAMRNRHSASLLQAFDTAFREQQNIQVAMLGAISALEQQKELILGRLAEAQRTHHTYDDLHQKAVRKQSRADDIKSQRQLDDIVASRKSAQSV